MLAEGSGQVDSAIAGVDGSVAERLEAANRPRPAWLECRMERGGKKPVLCAVLLVMGKGPCLPLSREWGGGGVLTLKVQEVTWSLGPKNRDSPGGRNKAGRDEMVSVFRAAGICLCVCRLIEFYLSLDSQREAPKFRSPAEGL